MASNATIFLLAFLCIGAIFLFLWIVEAFGNFIQRRQRPTVTRRKQQSRGKSRLSSRGRICNVEELGRVPDNRNRFSVTTGPFLDVLFHRKITSVFTADCMTPVLGLGRFLVRYTVCMSHYSLASHLEFQGLFLLIL